jgi:hypothetical protein
MRNPTDAFTRQSESGKMMKLLHLNVNALLQIENMYNVKRVVTKFIEEFREFNLRILIKAVTPHFECVQK